MVQLLSIVSGLLAVALSQVTGEDGKVSYDGYSVFRTTETDHPAVQSLQPTLEVWKVIQENSTYLDILVRPEMKELVLQLLSCAGAEYSVLIPDLQQSINQENIESTVLPSFRGACSTTSGMSWTKYQSYETIARYMDCLSDQYGHLAQLFNIGMTSEGRSLKVLKIGSGGRGLKKPAIWIDGGIHAREWISPATVSFILHDLVENTDQHSEILDEYDFYVMPSMNPDGYEYSRLSNRMWRKTRSNNRDSSCKGVDPNRNFGYEWGGLGTSSDPCSDIYRGTEAFSEPETAAVRDFILARSRNIKMYLTFHSYGQMVLYPWGFGVKDHSDEPELFRVGSIGSKAMGNKYTVGSAAKVLYPAAGGSDDWAKGGAGIRYSYTIELPDTGSYGFILPASQILPVATEALAAVTAMSQAIGS